MSKSFAAYWREERLDEVLPTTTLTPRLGELVEAPLVRKAGALLLQPLIEGAPAVEHFQDLTGYAALANKIHVDSFVDENASPRHQVSELLRQGTRAAMDLSRRLTRDGQFRVTLSLDVETLTMTLRFFERLDAEPWGTDNPDDYEHEAVLMVDTDARR